MRIAIEVVWWIGLLGALVPTLVIVKEAFLVIGTLQRIHQLAGLTHVAAQGIVVHVDAVPKLQRVGELVTSLDDAAGEATTALYGVAQRLARSGRLL